MTRIVKRRAGEVKPPAAVDTLRATVEAFGGSALSPQEQGHDEQQSARAGPDGRMISIYELKPRFQALLRPLARACAAAGITANVVTIAAMLISIALGIALSAGPRELFLLLPLWMFVRMAFNAIDGMLAREFGQKSVLGAYLNELSDVISDAALYLPFVLIAPFGWASVGAVVLLSTMSEMAGALGPMVGAERRYDGPMGKSDRAFVFGALGLWVGLSTMLPQWAFWTMPAVALAIALNIANRIRAGVASAK